MAKEKWEKAGKWAGKVGSALKDGMNTAKSEYKKSAIKKKVDRGAQGTKQFLDDKGITDTAKMVAQSASSKLDTMSGAKTLQLVEERLALQEKYNDILATKLDEALKRIEALESKDKSK